MLYLLRLRASADLSLEGRSRVLLVRITLWNFNSDSAPVADVFLLLDVLQRGLAA